MRTMKIRFALLLALAVAATPGFAVQVSKQTLGRSIEACQKIKRATDPTAPKDPAQLLSLCTCATEGYFAGFTKAEWAAIKKQAEGKDKGRAAMEMKDRTDVAEIACRKTLKIEVPKD